MLWIIAIKEIDHWQIANRYDAISVFAAIVGSCRLPPSPPPPSHWITSFTRLVGAIDCFQLYALLMVAHTIIRVYHVTTEKRARKWANREKNKLSSIWREKRRWEKPAANIEKARCTSRINWHSSFQKWTKRRMKIIDGHAHIVHMTLVESKTVWLKFEWWKELRFTTLEPKCHILSTVESERRARTS